MSDDSAASNTDGSCDTFFSETGSGKHVPRAIYVDLEDTVIGKLSCAYYDSVAIILLQMKFELANTDHSFILSR